MCESQPENRQQQEMSQQEPSLRPAYRQDKSQHSARQDEVSKLPIAQNLIPKSEDPPVHRSLCIRRMMRIFPPLNLRLAESVAPEYRRGFGKNRISRPRQVSQQPGRQSGRA